MRKRHDHHSLALALFYNLHFSSLCVTCHYNFIMFKSSEEIEKKLVLDFLLVQLRNVVMHLYVRLCQDLQTYGNADTFAKFKGGKDHAASTARESYNSKSFTKII